MAEPLPRAGQPGFAQSLRAILGALAPKRTRQFGLVTLLTLANAIADLLLVASAMLFLAALAGTTASLPQPLGDWLELSPGGRQIGVAAMVFAGSALIANGVRLLLLWRSETFVAGVAHELNVEVQRRIFAQPYAWHVAHHSSAHIASLEKVQLLAFYIFHQWFEGVAAVATGGAILGLLLMVDPLAALAALAGFLILYLVIARLSARRLATNSRRLGRAYDERVRTIQDSLGAIRDLIIDHSERAQLDEFRQADARLASAQANTSFIAGAPRYAIEAAAALLLAMLAALAPSTSALVLIGGVAIGAMRVLPLLQSAYRSWATMAVNRTIAGDVLELLDLPVPDDDEGPPAPLPFGQSIDIDAVTFRYPTRSHPALSEVTASITCGQRVALVGETGSGKSTLADVVMGLLQPDSGRILVDGIRIGPANVRSWQRNLAHVSQSIFLADASIARNIAFSVPDAPPDMERVRRAAAEAEIAGFIESLADGYDTTIGERGARLSGGQRQRIAIARALYKDAPLLILDEATNALDEETEAKVLANVFADQGRTILIIAHRQSAIRHCDQVIRIADGRIADS